MSEGDDGIETRLSALARHGVTIIDPRQTWVGPDVDLSRIAAGVVLHPGTRLSGARTLLGEAAIVGREGPAALVDTVLAARARIDSGFAQRAVLLADASAGANAHLRDGTVLEEAASTAHAVGLKHTILFPFVTLGSLINFCDCLMAGGSSRRDHSEVGSGFIHFNYTPWGEHGDKATPSLFGDVARGVFLREPRIFLGGSAGVVGPRQVGFGSVIAAGQVLRKDVGDGRLVAQGSVVVDQARPDNKPSHGKIRRNIEYVANLVALAAFYEQVRLARSDARSPYEHAVLIAARENIETAIAERRKRLDALLAEHEHAPVRWPDPPIEACPIDRSIRDADPTADHMTWIRGLTRAQVDAGSRWLATIVSRFVELATA